MDPPGARNGWAPRFHDGEELMMTGSDVRGLVGRSAVAE